MKKVFAAVFIVAGLISSGTYISPTPVAASGVDVIEESCRGSRSNNSALCDDGNKSLFGANSVFRQVTNAFLFLVGAIAIIMIVYGGLRYATAGGNEASVKSARSIIINSVIGLVIALMAYAIVEFTLSVI